MAQTHIPSAGDAFRISIRFVVKFCISEAISETIIAGPRRLLSEMAQTRILLAGDAFHMGIGYVVGLFHLFHLFFCCVGLAGRGVMCDLVG